MTHLNPINPNLSNCKTAGLFFLLLCLGGCSVFQNIGDKIRKPVLSIEDMRITGFNFQQMELVYDIKIENPNAVAVNLNSYDYKLVIADHLLVQGDQPENLEVEASGESIFQLPVVVSFSEAYQSAVNMGEADEVSYAFTGNLTFDLPIMGQTDLPMNKEGTLPSLKPPEISIQMLKLKNINMSKADLNLTLLFNNPNEFGFDINALKYNLLINEDQWAQGKALQDVKIKENDLTQLDIPLSLNISQMGLSAYRILIQSDSLDYRLKGTFNVDTFDLLGETNFDFDRSGTISVQGD